MDDSRLKHFSKWVIVLGTIFVAASFLLFIVYNSWISSVWLMRLVNEHSAAIIGLPMAAMAALVIVLLLEFSVGHISFKFAGFHFKGASGPMVLWVMSFLSMVIGIKLLW